MATYKYQYETQVDRTNIIEQHKDLILLEDQIITEGNFLIFSDTKRIEENVQDSLNNQLIIMEAMADLYDSIATINTGGTV